MKDIISFNFGSIRDTVARLSAVELIREENSKTLDKFLTLVKKSPALTKQHFVYKNIETAKPFQKERLAERFIAQNLQLFRNERWDNILSENKRARKELLDDIHIESKLNTKLAESINTLIEHATSPMFTDFEKEQEAYEYILSHLMRPVISEGDASPEKTDNPSLIDDAWKFVTKVAVNNFNERYQHLNEEEKKLFSILVSDEKTRISYLDELKNNNLKLIESKLEKETDIKSIDLLNSFKEKIENMKNVNFVNVDECIISNAELKEALDE